MKIPAIGKAPVMPDFDSLMQNTEKVLNGVKPEFRDLFKAQMQVNNYALRVELVSKTAESASGTMRRLQQG